MKSVAAVEELYDACRVVFGPEMRVSREFLEYLQWGGVKSAYRKRVKETHPDTLTDGNPCEMAIRAEMFRTLQNAYEDLTAYLAAREKGYRLPAASLWREVRTGRPRSTCARKKSHGTIKRFRSARSGVTSFSARCGFGAEERKIDEVKLYKGPIPDRKLFFGHFLYYSGIIPFHSIIQALVWQRTQRPRIGEIGRSFGFLDEKAVLHILKSKKGLQTFGQSALMQGFLTSGQLDVLLLRQKVLQKKIGTFFVEKKMLTAEQLHSLLVRHYSHNAGFGASCARN